MVRSCTSVSRRSALHLDNAFSRYTRPYPAKPFQLLRTKSTVDEETQPAGSDMADSEHLESMYDVDNVKEMTSISPIRPFDCFLRSFCDVRDWGDLNQPHGEDTTSLEVQNCTNNRYGPWSSRNEDGQRQLRPMPAMRNILGSNTGLWKKPRTTCPDNNQVTILQSGRSTADLINFRECESRALTTLEALLHQSDVSQSVEDVAPTGNKIDVIWPLYYRQAEMFSDKLPGRLDCYLQIWARLEADTWPTRSSGLYQGATDARSALHACCALGFVVLARIYLEMGHNPNILAYPSGQSALHLAAAGGHPKVIEVVLDRGANIEARTLHTGRTPLQIAAFRGHENTVELLLNGGADSNVKDNLGDTAYDLALRNGHSQTVNSILSRRTAQLSLRDDGFNGSHTNQNDNAPHSPVPRPRLPLLKQAYPYSSDTETDEPDDWVSVNKSMCGT